MEHLGTGIATVTVQIVMEVIVEVMMTRMYQR